MNVLHLTKTNVMNNQWFRNDLKRSVIVKEITKTPRLINAYATGGIIEIIFRIFSNSKLGQGQGKMDIE